MIKVSIICMIYKSTKFAKWVYDSVQKYTPMLKRGEAEFFFVANDPTVEVVDFLREKNYPFIVAIHEHLSAEELAELGIENREYLRRVYQAWNQGILHAKGQMVCLINSDNYFSDNWLENLMKYSNFNTYVVPQLVEPLQRGKDLFWCALHAEFGHLPEEFMEEDFLAFADKVRMTGIRNLGVFQPCLLYKDVAICAGLYPEGNRINADGSITTGDTAFCNRLMKMNVKHITALDSVVYHMGEGELLDLSAQERNMCDKKYARNNYIPMYKAIPHFTLENIGTELPQTENAEQIYEKLLVPYYDNPQVDKLCDNLKDIVFGEDRSGKLYLFCAGANGRRLHKNLLIRGLEADAFSDNNSKLWDTYVDSIKCIAPQELEKDSVIIVTKDEPEELVQELRSKGYKRVLTYQELKNNIDNTPVAYEERVVKSWKE